MARLLSGLLLLLILAASASAQVLLFNIDCGASAPHTDGKGVRWVADGAYVSGGDAHSMSTTAVTPELTTLRAFTSGKKNCYTIPIDASVSLGLTGRGLILVRASFYYGNYDGKASPPAFDLIFDGNLWASVETTATGNKYEEAIYPVGGEATSVCFGQSNPGQVPFVSAIEVRRLEESMYPLEFATWLRLRQRTVFGATRDIRYPDDPYDRIWKARGPGTGFVALRNESVISASSLNAISMPPAFTTAIGTNSTDKPISLSTGLPAENSDVSINLYFVEMEQMDLGSRYVDVVVDGDPVANLVVSEAVTESPIRRTANASTSFEVRTGTLFSSSFPPIISAMEVFTVGEERATDSSDVEGLATLKRLWPVLNESMGDPCLPTPYNWEWVRCDTNEDIPRITALFLGGRGLSGEIPDFGSLLTRLEMIDLSNNKLSGPIPTSLGFLLNLKELNLANNNLNGAVPTFLSRNSGIKLDASGNPNLLCDGVTCSPAPGRKKKSSNAGLIAGITVPLVILFCAAIAVFLICLRRRKIAAASSASASAGKPNGYGSPSGPPGHPQPPAPATHGGAAADIAPTVHDHRIEIDQQMRSELADLLAQQAQHQFGATRGPEPAPESTVLRQQQRE